MGRSIHRLTAVKVNALKRPGYHADGAGLYLKIQDGGSRSWVYRFMLNGRRRDCGLGQASGNKLRSRAPVGRRLPPRGRQWCGPIEQRAAERAQAANQMTFEQCGREFFGAHEPAWTNAEHRRQWLATLASYVFPLIGPQPVAAVDTAAVLNVLTPIWNEKPETANRIRGRIETVLDWAKTKGYRDGENPARWRGHLQHTLPAPRKLHQVVHFAALPYHEVSDLMAALREQTSITARALEFLILTASRAGEVRGARWDEIDVDDSMWALPPGRMKSGRKHRVPIPLRFSPVQ
ncbi:MAG: tyrosine-type recombinase/integrase [Hyphomicrobium sp.]|nr:tyrosine-type recombinase/integrase [Hyphomicrobium sp.]